MKKSTIIVIALVAIVAIWGVTSYNGLVKMDEGVNTAWSNVENQYQRRADLIAHQPVRAGYLLHRIIRILLSGMMDENQRDFVLVSEVLKDIHCCIVTGVDIG